jgi:uncharacterized protein YjbI with pentapeptide repeats
VVYEGILDHANLAGDTLTDLDLADASLNGADLAGTDLSGATMAGDELNSADLAGANLTGASLGSTDLTSAKLAGATLTGASGTSIAGSPASMPAHWSVRDGYLIGPGSDTYMTGADLSSQNLSGADFAGMSLESTNFQHANLAGASLAGADLSGANFTSANLTRADLLGAKVSSAWFAGTLWSDTTCPNGSKSGADPHHWCVPPPPSSGFATSYLFRTPASASRSFAARALSCPSATLCYGGGIFSDRSSEPWDTYQAALLRWQDEGWLTEATPFPPGVKHQAQAQNVLASTSCASTHMCMAGGSFAYQGMLLSWFGRKWTAIMAPLPAGATTNAGATVDGMSCPTTKTCVGVGSYDGAAGEPHGLILRWSGGTWRATAAPLPAGSDPNQSLSAVSCASATLCFAGGWQNDAAGQPQALLLAGSDSAWNPVQVPLPAGAAAEPQAEISGLDCPSVTRCVAVGSYQDTTGTTQGLLLTRSGNRWTAARAPSAWDAAASRSASLTTVSCPSASDCTAAGNYVDSAGQWLGLALRWSGKAWRPFPAPVAADNLRAISCPTTARCVAVGDSPGNDEIALVGP